MIFFFSGCGPLREIIARSARAVFGRSVVIVAAYTPLAMQSARRIGTRIILDRPDESTARQFERWTSLDGVDVELEVIGLSENDAMRIVPLAPDSPREVIAINGSHSEHEAIAFDLHMRGHSYDEIAGMMACDMQTAKTYIIRARLKNRHNRQMEEAIRLCMTE